MSVKSHLDSAAAYIAVAESSDAKRLAYEKAADEILAALAEDDTLTQAEVGRRLGKSATWVKMLVSWRRHAHDGLPFARGEAQQRYVERKVPTRHKDRVEMATKLLADPKVAKAAVKTVLEQKGTHASRVIDNTVHDHHAAEREKARARAEQARKDKALPLPAYMAAMVVKMNDWAGELEALVDDLDTLPDGSALDAVGRAAAHLHRASGTWVERLNRKPELKVIEGRARRSA